jgi:regulator of sigma E protease
VVILGAVILIHEFGHFIAAKLCGVRVEKFSLGFGRRLVSVKKGDTEYMISAIPLGGYIKMSGDEAGEKLTGARSEFLSRSVLDRFKIIFAGPLFNYIFAFALFTAVFMAGTPVLTNEIGAVMEGYPAKQAGLMAGDSIIEIDGRKISYGDVLVAAINRHTKGAMTLTVRRQDKVFKKEIKPVVEVRKTGLDNKEVRIARIGIQPAQKIEKGGYGFFGSVYMGARATWQVTAITYEAIWLMVTGRLSLREMTGPIGIFMFTAQAAKLGLIYVVNLTALLSASLAIFNLLPLPVLDGGHIFFLMIEKIRGKPVSGKTQEAIGNIGIGLLILLTVVIFYNDIAKFGLLKNIIK